MKSKSEVAARDSLWLDIFDIDSSFFYTLNYPVIFIPFPDVINGFIMKLLFLSLTLLCLANGALALTFSGGKDNIVHQISAEVLQHAYRRIGLQPQFVYLQLQESLNQANAGMTDGEISKIKIIKIKYPNLVEIPVVINYVEGIAFSKDDSFNINKWSDLASYKIAIAKGAKFIETGTKGMDRVMAEGFEEAFELLQNDEVDIIVTPKTTGIFITYNNKYSAIRPVGTVLQRIDLYHFVHEKNEYIIPLLTPVLKQMSESGEIDYIRGSYLNKILGF